MESPEQVNYSPEYEINSAESDKGLSDIAFVLHGNSSVEDSQQIVQEGMKVQEGRATVSTDIARALSWATTADKRAYSQSPTERKADEVGRVFVIAPPEDLNLGYGMFTSAKIDELHKEVKGAPVKYASGRKQLAFYESDDTEAARKQIETLHTLGRDPQSLDLPPENILMSLYPSTELQSWAASLQDKVKSFENPDLDESTFRLCLSWDIDIR